MALPSVFTAQHHSETSRLNILTASCGRSKCTRALRPAYDELAAQLPAQDILDIDETPTKQAADKSWLWTCVATTFTVFALRLTRAATVLEELLTEEFADVVNCDRAKMYYLLPRLQWCWAHLKRDFQALVDSTYGQQKCLGRDLLRSTRKLFQLWARYRDGTITWRGFQRLMQPVRSEIDSLLLRGAFSGNARAVRHVRPAVEAPRVAVDLR